MVIMSSKKEYWNLFTEKDGTPLVQRLQKRQIVNDQSFPSFAIRPRQSELLVSYADEKYIHMHHQRVLYGTLLSLVGFIIQFVGIRNLHYGVSIAQLVAMLCVTSIRVFIQNPFSEPPNCKELITDFELDWMTFEVHKINLWSPRVAPLKFRSTESNEERSSVELVLNSRITLGEMADNLG